MRSRGLQRAARYGPLARRSAALAALVLLAAGAAWSGPNPFRNVWNAPFASVSNGPQGAIVVEDAATDGLLRVDAAQRQRGIEAATAQQHSPQALSQPVAALRYLRQHGVKRVPEFRSPRLIVHTSGGVPILPDLDRALATGGTIGGSTNDITFTFQGFSSADETAYRAYLAKAMPVARAVYGPPAFDIDVTVIQEKGLVAVQGGTYDVTTNEIRLPEIDPGNHNWPEDTFVLMLLVLNAFHDDVALLYDSWEQGMVGAAATVVQTSPRVSPSYNPYFPNPFYFGSVYEPMNQPALGNSTWYPASGAANMLYWRISEARSAWHKCYVEDAQFFQRFNTQYYAKLNPLSAADRAVLSGDTPALLELCQAVLPTVEGAPFVSWYRQQFVLDTSVTVGPKLYCCNTPLYDYIPLIVEHYMTDSTGDETPRGGTANLTYYNYDFSLTLYAQEGYTITLPSVSDPANGIYAGEGYLSPAFMNIGGAQRITVQMELNGLLGRYTYPYGVRDFLGDGTNLNDVYGAIIGPTEGTIDVVGLGGLTDVQVTKGIWSGVINNHMLDPAQLKVTFDDGNGNQVTRTINVAYDSYDVLLSAGSRSVLAKNLPYGTSGLYMISLPLWPVEPDAAQALGIPASDLLLARWKPGAPAGGGYEIYPTLDPMAPGRGYWLRILNDVTVAVDGVLPSGDSDVLVPLGAGWNMIGCARNSNIDLGELQVQRGTDSQPFADAVADGWVQGGLWAYGQLAGYSLVQKLKPFEGYWLRCLLPEGATLVFPSAAAAAARESAVAEEYSPYGDTTWKTTLLLEVADARSSATLGVAPGAGDGLDARCDLQAPPAFGDQPTLGFFDKAWGSQAGEYASDFRGASTRNPWQLRVSSVPEGVPARLRWPDLSELPRDVRPVLVDPARGREVSMRTAAGYEFTGTGAPAEMEIQLRRGSSGALAVMGLAGVPTRQGVEVTYVLSADAAVTATVLNVAGRPIRDLVQDKPQSAGRATLLWDLRASDGLPVPNGAYLVELAARSEDGQLARGLSRVSVFR